MVRSFIPGTPYQSSLILNNQCSPLTIVINMYLVTQPGTPLPVDPLFVRLLFKVEVGGEGETEGGKQSGSDHHHQAQSHQLLILMKRDDRQGNVLYED